MCDTATPLFPGMFVHEDAGESGTEVDRGELVCQS